MMGPICTVWPEIQACNLVPEVAVFICRESCQFGGVPVREKHIFPDRVRQVDLISFIVYDCWEPALSTEKLLGRVLVSRKNL